jgi:hypothetical protein
MRLLAAFLTAAVCFIATGAANAQPEKRIMLSQILEAPLLGEPTRHVGGKQQPEIAAVKDLLVGDDGHTEVIVVAAQSSSAGRVIPWSELVYDPIRNDFTLRAQDGDLKRFPSLKEPISGTKLLASKLLNGLVQRPSGERLGEVKDVQIGGNGALERIFYRHDNQTASIPWKGIDVQPERPHITASPGAEAVLVIERKKL